MALDGVLRWCALQSKLSMIIGLVQQTSAMGEKHAKVLQALLRRVCMHGHVPWNTLTPFFDAIQNQEGNPKACRVLHYLTALVLSSGSAGTLQTRSLSFNSHAARVCRAQACHRFEYGI